MKARGRLTQREIARLAGVSQATVSLVLNDAKAAEGRIPEETRARVNRAIRETGYVADPIARRMSKGLNRILGVFTYEPAFPSEQADFFGPFLLGIEESAQRLGYDLLLLTGSTGGAGGRKIFHEHNRLRLADGCVILGRQFDRAELERLVAGDYPFVAVGRREDAGAPVPYVGGDYVTATAELVRRAKSLGHRKLAYVGPSDGPESSRDRWLGFLSEQDGTKLVLHIPDAGGVPEQIFSAVRQSGATTVFLTELADAIGVHAAALSAGISVPTDLSIVVLGSHIRPTRTGVLFTTFSIPREEMARQATAMLAERIEGGGRGAQVLLPCPLLDGETLAPPAASLGSRS